MKRFSTQPKLWGLGENPNFSEGIKPAVFFFAVISFLVISVSPVQNAFGETFETVVEFSLDDLIFSRVKGYDVVEIDGERSFLFGEPGEPWLPARDIHILLPMGRVATALSVEVLGEITLDGDYYIIPAQPAHRMSDPEPDAFTPPNPAAYASNFPVPAIESELIDTFVLRGYYIASVRVYPVTYIPSEGILFLKTRYRLTLEIEESPEITMTSLLPAEPVFKTLVEDGVENPEDVEPEYGTLQILSPTATDEVKYLLITSSSLFDAFMPLLEWKTKKGVPAQAVSVEWIYSNYAGPDNQYKIKACIKDYVENKDTVWVVLGGDDTIIPDRDCYASVNGGIYTDATIPSDIYYAGLDVMNWDTNNDGISGQAGVDTVDFGPDVFVGRLPVRTGADATAIVNKTIAYEKDPPMTNFAEKILLSGVKLWNLGDAEAKTEYMYSTWIAPYWDGIRYRFYDTNTDFAGGASYDVTAVNMNAQWLLGYNFMHMATHGSQVSWGMEAGGGYTRNTVGSATNTGKYVNVLTIACNTNAFDSSANDPCLSEAFIRKADAGAVTYIGSSRYGWGYATMSSHGPSFQYDRMFYQFLFNGESVPYPHNVGAVYTRMKEYHSGSASYEGAMRWLQYGINLMGDPELPLYTANPSTFDPSYPGAIPVGTRTMIIETGVPDSVVCLYKGDEVYEYGTADSNGRFEKVINALTSGDMSVTITAHNFKPYEGTISVQAVGEEDAYEENNSFITAFDLRSYENMWLSEIAGLATQYDSDCFLVSAGTGATTLVVDVRFAHNQGNIDISLHDATGTLVSISQSQTDNEYISYNLPASGNYYIHVYGDNSGNVYDLLWKTISKVADPVLSPEPGSYKNSVTVSISCATPGAVVRYTTNGTTPTVSSPVYSGPFTLINPRTVKAKAYKSGMTSSNVTTGVYQVYVPARYNLYLYKTGNGRIRVNDGDIVRMPITLDFEEGENVKLQAVPNSDTMFVSWTGSINSTTNPVWITMNSEKTVITNFEFMPSRVLSLIKTGNGKIRINDGPVVRMPLQMTFNHGASVKLEAVPNADTQFTEWSGSLSGSTNPVTITMDSDKNITANYVNTVQSAYTLSLTKTGNGRIRVNNGDVQRMPLAVTLPAGSTVKLEAVPNSDTEFSEWSGSLSGSTNPAYFTLDNDMAITVNYAFTTQTKSTLYLTKTGNGRVRINDGPVVRMPLSATFDTGSVIKLEAVPNDDTAFSEWSGALSGSTNPVYFMLDGDTEITANYIFATGTTSTLSLAKTGNGRVRINGGAVQRVPLEITVNTGEKVLLEAVPNEDTEFIYWSGDYSSDSGSMVITMDSDIQLYAHFLCLEQ